MAKDYLQLAYSYVDDVLSGRQVANKDVKASCKRWLAWFSLDDRYFDEKEVNEFIGLIELMQHANRKPFILEPWQVFFMCAVYGFKWRKNDRRCIKTVYLSVGRKNGKTALVGAIALLHLLYEDKKDPKEPEVLIVANGQEQAKILYKFSYDMAKKLDEDEEVLQPKFKDIKNTVNNGYIKAMPSVAERLDGYGASVFCLDEVHENKNSAVYDVMVSGQGARNQPLGYLITTRGTDPLSFCKEFEDNALRVTHGELEDDSIFSLVYGLDEDDDWEDPANFPKANPNLGVTVLEDYLLGELKKAKNFGGSVAVNFKIKNLNIWQDSADTWIEDEILLQSMNPVAWEDFRGKEVYVGADLASTGDLTAVSFLADKGDGDLIIKTLAWIPKGTIEKRSNRAIWEAWIRDGWLHTVNGNVTDYGAIVDEIVKLRDDYNMDIMTVLYDSFDASQFGIDAKREGLPLTEHGQKPAHFSRAMKAMEIFLNGGEGVIIDYNKLMRYNFSCVIPEYDKAGKRQKPTKDSEYKKIDMVISALQALGGYLYDHADMGHGGDLL